MTSEQDRYDQYLRLHVAALLGDGAIADAFNKTQEIIGPENIPVTETDAQEAFDRLSLGEPINAKQRLALDLVIRMTRPAVETRRGTVDPLPVFRQQDPVLSALWAAFTPASAVVANSVGRINDRNGAHIGTGWVAAPHVIVTNRHVANDLGFGISGYVDPQSTIIFGSELNEPNNTKPTAFSDAYAHPEADIALLRTVDPTPPAIATNPAPAAEGDWVVAIGYPGETAPPPPVYVSVFGGALGVRRASPGVIRTAVSDSITHDCSTIGGSSGSPLVSLDSGQVVGLHRGGRSRYENRAVPSAIVEDFLSQIGAK